MRLPWVSRAHYELLLHNYGELRADVRTSHTLYENEAKRFDVLLGKFTALRLQGATIPDAVIPRTAKEIDPLTQAVLDASKGKPPAIRTAMFKQLAVDRDNPLMEDADILRRIESGFASDDVGVPE